MTGVRVKEIRLDMVNRPRYCPQVRNQNHASLVHRQGVKSKPLFSGDASDVLEAVPLDTSPIDDDLPLADRQRATDGIHIRLCRHSSQSDSRSEWQPCSGEVYGPSWPPCGGRLCLEFRVIWSHLCLYFAGAQGRIQAPDKHPSATLSRTLPDNYPKA